MLRSLSEELDTESLLAQTIKDEELGLNADDEKSTPDALSRKARRQEREVRARLAKRHQEFFHHVFVEAPQQITDATLQSEYFKSIVAILKQATLNFIDALSVMAIPVATSTVAEAFGVSPDFAMTVGMGLAIPQLLLKVAADNDVERAELLYTIASTTYRAFNFFAYVLVLYISSYLVIEQISKGVGNDTPVDVSDQQYYLQFVLATGLVSVTYAAVLELAKNKLDDSDAVWARSGRALLEVCRSAGIAGNLNALAKYALKPLGWKPTGNENEVTRFLGFEAICCFSLFLQLMCMCNKTAGKYISNTVNAISIVTYGLFLNESRKQFSEKELAFIYVMFAGTGLLAATLAKFYPGEDINDRPRPPRS